MENPLSDYKLQEVIFIARLSTCVVCETKITKEEKKIYGNKPHCEKCYNSKIIESEQYNLLKDSICVQFNIPTPSGLILKQIKDYKEQYKYTYSGIRYCLWYITEIKKVKLEVKYGIALVKFEYENAKAYYAQQSRISDSVSIEKPIDKIRLIKIKRIDNETNKFLLNLDDL